MSDQQINPGWASRRVAEGWDAVEILVEFWHTSDHGAFLDDAAREVLAAITPLIRGESVATQDEPQA